jgi:hypothetical protein
MSWPVRARNAARRSSMSCPVRALWVCSSGRNVASVANFRGRPRQLTAIVKAIQTLQYLIRDPFGTARVDTAS